MSLMAQETIAWRQEYCKISGSVLTMQMKQPFELVVPNVVQSYHSSMRKAVCFCGVLCLSLLAQTDIFCFDCLACVTTKIPGKGGLILFCLTHVPFTHLVQNSLLSIVMTVFSLCSLSFEYASLYFSQSHTQNQFHQKLLVFSCSRVTQSPVTAPQL